MYRLALLSVLLCLLCAGTANAQKSLPLTAPHYCQYGGDSLSRDLYTFSNDPEIEALADKILRLTTGEEAHFQLMAANVQDIVAVLDDKKRYILCNRLYFKKLKDENLWAALLAHAIGHHVREHGFSRLAAVRQHEEIEADKFMGYALRKLGIPRSVASEIPIRLPLGHASDSMERRMAILYGWDRAQLLFDISDKASYYDDNKNKVDLDFPSFEFPPPAWSGKHRLSTYFGKCKTLGAVASKLEAALDSNRYFSKSYFQVRGGFALVSGMEQFNENGSCKPDEDRWSLRPVIEKSFSLLGYLKSLVDATSGYFRVFVFIVTPENLEKSNKTQRITREDAIKWLDSGRGGLSKQIASQKFTADGTQVIALVYEFRMPESTRKAVQTLPGSLTAEQHLRMSGILKHLKQ